MSITAGQQRILLALIGRLAPQWRRDGALPFRIERMLRADRRFGARDRRLYRELLYAAVRHLPWVEAAMERGPDAVIATVAWLAADTPDTRAFRAAVVPGAAPPPSAVAERARGLAAATGAPVTAASLLPGWFRAECPEAFEAPDFDVLNARAPLWVRLQGPDRSAALGEFTSRGWRWRPGDFPPGAVEILDPADVTATEAYRRGLVEVQDIGSQLVLESVGVDPGGAWLDACAGAGGKALQLACLLGPGGRVDAMDIRAAALDELTRRAARAGLGSRISRVPVPRGPYDGVLVDAPCSGTGTWRRSPHLKWTTTPVAVAGFARRQAALLAANAGQVRPGGRLVYATCSLCRSENEDVVDAFLRSHPEFSPAPASRPGPATPRGPGLLFRPAATGGDGFFCAILVLRP
jgi:16S rRNA (cytosine967-C5)-methyltransferase